MKTKPKSTRNLQFETLQARELMAVDLAAGQLDIVGTDNNDQIAVEEQTLRLPRIVNGRISFVNMDVIRVSIRNDAGNLIEPVRTFNAAAIDKLHASGLGGDDEIINDTSKPSTLSGGAGNDRLRGGSGADVLSGDADHDSLYGRAGTDTLVGGSGSDGLFGGRDFDFLSGGSGADRYLRGSGTNDYILGVGSSDAIVDFRNTGLSNTDFGLYNGSAWTDEEIELVDSALADMQMATANTRLLKLSDGARLKFLRRGDPLTANPASADGIVVAWNDRGVISLTNSALDGVGGVYDSEDWLRQTVFHEVAHNWDEATENSSVPTFRQISGWTDVDPNTYIRRGLGFSVILNPDFRAADGNVSCGPVGANSQCFWYRSNADFARDYGRTNPREDFASSFAAFMMDDDFIVPIGEAGTEVLAKEIYMNGMFLQALR